MSSGAPPLSPRQLFVEIVRDHLRPREPPVERNTRSADQKPCRDNAGIGAGGQPPRRLLDHQLLLRREAQYLRETPVAELGIAPEADYVDHDAVRLVERVEHA